MNDVKLLSKATNYAVVQLPGRAYPGIVFQGDSLNGFIADLEEAADEDDPSEKAFGCCQTNSQYSPFRDSSVFEVHV